MKKLFFIFFLCIFFLPTTSVDAHTISVDKSIGAVLHIDPDDDPIIGIPTNFYFDFKDKNNRFALSNCLCRVVIKNSTEEIYNETLSPNSQLTSSFSFTFPTTDIYTISLIGKPLKSDGFEPFTLHYDIRVTRTPTQAANGIMTTIRWFGTHIIHFALAIVIFIFVLIAVIKKYINLRKK